MSTNTRRLLIALAVIVAFAAFFLSISDGPLPPGNEEERAAREFARMDSVQAADSTRRP